MKNSLLSTQSILSNLKTKVIGSSVLLLASVDSTNTQLKSIAVRDTAEGLLLIAEKQTTGRGRLGRSWFSNKGQNLTFSVLLQPTIEPQNFGLIPLLAGIAVARAIRSHTSLPAECKWPNDVLINGKKVCGVLSEMVMSANSKPNIIVGIGVNVNQSEFPEEIRSTATSLFLESGAEYDRVPLLCKVIEEMEYWYIQLQANKNAEIVHEWKTNCGSIGTPIAVDQRGEILEGIFADVAPDGALLLRQNGTLTRILAGEVTVLKNK